MNRMIFCIIVIMAMTFSSAVNAQFGKRLGGAVKRAAENTAVRKAEQKTEEAVSKAIDKATDPNSYENKNKQSSDETTTTKSSTTKTSTKQTKAVEVEASDDDDAATSTGSAAATPKAAEMAYAKSDFVPGDEIIFSDDFANEQMGEFPTQWDAGNGSIEVVQVNGEKVIELLDGGYMMPLMKSKKAYLPDVFTIEFDVYLRNDKLAKEVG
ncbi:MAG: hypothetical protein LBR18_03645, partial [Tannerella sp.]|nr:hypothetical protein [Tannerella sp.]